jgi:aspartyl/asparaginyl beta-hydroxylase (cupin superfamily)
VAQAVAQAMAQAGAPLGMGAEYKAIASAWRFQHLWQDGQWVAEAAAQFPRTVALLQRLEAQHGLRLNPLQNVACGFARQPAGSGIAPHCDGNLLGLTAHLGLQVPDGCWIEVGGERRSWQERKLLLMDTSQQHRTHNGGESDRYILMLNVLRPQVEAAEVALLEHYMSQPRHADRTRACTWRRQQQQQQRRQRQQQRQQRRQRQRQ